VSGTDRLGRVNPFRHKKSKGLIRGSAARTRSRLVDHHKSQAKDADPAIREPLVLGRDADEFELSDPTVR